jgi:hypothetical protein
VGVPLEENYVYKSESRIKLRDVEYSTFLGAVKRFGYRIDLNDEHIKSISREIKLNVEEMNSLKTSPFCIVYKDPQFFFKNSRHSVPNLLRLGFLLCSHPSEVNQELDAWHLINPTLQETVSKQQVRVLLEELSYVALDMNLSKRLINLVMKCCRLVEIGR